MSDPPTPAGPWTQVAELYEAWYEPTLERLARRYPTADRDHLHDACVKAILQIGGEIDRFDPTRGTIEKLLYGAAERNLWELHRADERRVRRERKKAERDVTEAGSATGTLLDRLADRELAQRAIDRVASSDQDRRLLALWASGVEDLREYARVLGIEDLPEAEQAARATLARDRLKQRLRRLRDRFPELGGNP